MPEWCLCEVKFESSFRKSKFYIQRSKQHTEPGDLMMLRRKKWLQATFLWLCQYRCQMWSWRKLQEKWAGKAGLWSCRNHVHLSRRVTPYNAEELLLTCTLAMELRNPWAMGRIQNAGVKRSRVLTIPSVWVTLDFTLYHSLQDRWELSFQILPLSCYKISLFFQYQPYVSNTKPGVAL